MQSYKKIFIPPNFDMSKIFINFAPDFVPKRFFAEKTSEKQVMKKNTFLHRIDKDLVKGVIDSMPHTDLYYCGFSLGAWDFHKYVSTGDYKKAILIDGYDTNFASETSLEDVIVVQSYENHCDEYEMALYSMW